MKLSIIIPCYNTQNYIERCVESVLSQKNHTLSIEMILCNDGSKDNTLQIISNLQDKYPNIVQVFNNENQGVYKTRNFALTKITGDYVWLLDSDDEVSPNALLTVEKVLSSNTNIDILNFGYKVENKRGVFSTKFPPNIKECISGISFLEKNDGRLYLWNNIYNISFLKKENIRFLAKSMSLEDSLFNIEAFSKAKKVKLNQEVLYTYYFNQNSISKKPTLENRLKQGESSVNVHTHTKNIRNKYPINSEEYNIIDNKLKHSVLGFFFSLLKEQYPIYYVKEIIALYKKENLYPISPIKNSNKKAYTFRKIANIRILYLFLCRLNLLIK